MYYLPSVWGIQETTHQGTWAWEIAWAQEQKKLNIKRDGEQTNKKQQEKESNLKSESGKKWEWGNGIPYEGQGAPQHT